MARFPRYERQQGLSAGSTGSFASAGAFTAPAEALANAGGAVANLGAQFQERTQKIQNSQDDTWFSKARAETALQMQQAQQELRQSATDGAVGYTDAVRERYEGLRQQYLEGAPSDRARQMFDEWSYSYNASVVGDAAKFQAQATLAKRDDDFAQTMVAHSQTVLADPSQYDTVKRRAMDDLEGAKQWMTPEQEIKARNAVDQQLQLARAQAEIQSDPKRFLQDIGLGGAEQSGPLAVDSVVNKIIGAESSGNTNAKNPNSSASGLGQFIDSTWLKTVKAYRPDVAAGKSDSEILALKNNPALGREMTKRYTEENAATLTAAGLPATAGNIYLAHFLGPGGAKQVLRAGDDTSLGSLLSPAVISANSFLRGKSVGWIKNWSAKKMGGGGTPNVASNERFSALDVGQVIGLQQQAENQVAQLQTQQKAEQTAVLADVKGAFQLGIATGDTSVTQHSILSSPLADDDKAQLINSLNTKQKDTRLATDAITRMDAGGDLNPYNADDKKGVSLAYDAVTGGASLFGEESTAQAALGYMYSRSRIVPKTASNEIRAGLISSDPLRVAAAASVAAQLENIDRGGLEATDNGQALLDAATKYNHLTQTLGLTNEEAGQRMVDMSDPEKQRQRDALLNSEPVKKRVKNIDVSEVRDIYDPGILGFDPDLGDTPAAEAAMLGDYKSMFEESIVEANGDLELAKDLASQRFQRLYGPSSLTMSGSDVITRLPPEKTYPPGPDGTHGYVGEQAREALAAEGVEAENVFLQYYDDTETDFRSGKTPRYQIWYERNGVIEMYNLPFYADPAVAGARAAEEQEIRIDESRQRRDANRQQTVDFNERGTAPALQDPVSQMEQPDPSMMQDRFFDGGQ